MSKSTLSDDGVFELEKKLKRLLGLDVTTESNLEFLIFLSPIKKMLLMENFLFMSILRKILILSALGFTALNSILLLK